MKNRRHRLRQESQLQPTSRNADNEDEGDAWDSLVTKTLDQLVLACCSFPPSIVPVYEPLFKKALSLIKRQQQTQGQQSHNGAGKRSTMVACRFPETDSASDWERTAGSLVRNEDVLKQRSATTVDCLFYIAANLTQTAEEYDNSFETNCQRFIEALSEAVTRGAPTDNLDRFFRLCIHLKDAHGQYPIRHLVTRACLQILDHKTVSSNTTSWLLRFILGPADYILYHLESRLALIPKAQALKVDRQTFDDMETRALVERLARILKLAPQSFLAEQIRYRAYSYLERMCHDPVRWSKSNNILKEMPIVQWKLCLDKDPLLWILMDRHPEAFVHFWASMSLHGLECSPLEHREEKLMRQLNVECIGIPELLSTTLEQSLERAWREDRDSLMSMLSCEAGGQWTVVNELRDGMLQSANRVVKQNPRISRAPDVSFTLIKDMSILAQRLASVVMRGTIALSEDMNHDGGRWNKGHLTLQSILVNFKRSPTFDAPSSWPWCLL
ncbi:hypothetical protein BGZ73_001206 [Actinomortierella ambigua]|nr:hypothetical protein BGZ73_001206 [Actinomortierella ambigua]